MRGVGSKVGRSIIRERSATASAFESGRAQPRIPRGTLRSYASHILHRPFNVRAQRRLDSDTVFAVPLNSPLPPLPPTEVRIVAAHVETLMCAARLRVFLLREDVEFILEYGWNVHFTVPRKNNDAPLLVVAMQLQRYQ